MTKGELIELRLQMKLCIRCGLHPSIDWPYICDACMKELGEAQAAKRQRPEGDDDPWVIH
jgi:hypothetical protein